MIVTVTANPSLDRTAALAGELQRGEVHRLVSATVEAGGKGVNVARAIRYAGRDVLAVLPAADSDPILGLLEDLGLAHANLPVPARVRTNITLTEPDGTTTKLNEPGTPMPNEAVAAFTELVLAQASGADWVVLSGSLPPGMPADWYARLVPALRASGCKVAVDTSDEPLAALAAAFPASAPDLLKPNSEELAQLSGADAAELEAAAHSGDVGAAVAAARVLVDAGVGAVLATLGSAGAVLVTDSGAWRAVAPPITLRSTFGAGDSSVAGYVMASLDGLDAPERLAAAVAYGSAAASLAGSGLPRPDQVEPSLVLIESCPESR